jgi:hypothetical protein
MTGRAIAIFAILASLGLIGVTVLVVEVTARGCENSHSGGGGIAINASKGRCFGH